MPIFKLLLSFAKALMFLIIAPGICECKQKFIEFLDFVFAQKTAVVQLRTQRSFYLLFITLMRLLFLRFLQVLQILLHHLLPSQQAFFC